MSRLINNCLGNTKTTDPFRPTTNRYTYMVPSINSNNFAASKMNSTWPQAAKRLF